MPIEYRIDEELRIMITRVKGMLSDADLLDYAERVRKDPNIKVARHEIVDMNDVSLESNVTAEGVRKLADYWRSMYDWMSGGKLALIASNGAAFGMARMYKSLRDDGPDTIQVFRDEAAAITWLLDEATETDDLA